MLGFDNKTLVMGILNITPDSFFDGGESFLTADAIARAEKMQAEGADIIDVGACSTAPNSAPVTQEEELNRLKRVLPALMKTLKVPVSIDTLSVGSAQYALSLGVSIVNDESGFFNPDMAELVKKHNSGWVFMHTGGFSSKKAGVYKNGIVNEVSFFFKRMKAAAVDFGISPDRLIFDYGIGFGKSRTDDLTLLDKTDVFVKEYPNLLVGVSRKRVIGEAVHEPEPENRLFGTLSANAIAVYKGASVLRVHDVKPAVDCIRMCNAIKKGMFDE